METFLYIFIMPLSFTLYSLEKLIEWKQKNRGRDFKAQKTLYSLEKLIEWKLGKNADFPFHIQTLYSLEKLIEWKLYFPFIQPLDIEFPLLAREINWMETLFAGVILLFWSFFPLLAREINWMET